MLTPLLIIVRAVHIGVLVLLAGIFAFNLVMLAPTRRFGTDDFHEIERRLFRLALWSLVAALFSALLWFWLEVADMSGLALKNAFSATACRTVLFDTQFGRVWQLRLALIAAAFVLVGVVLAKAKARRALAPVVWLVSVVFLVSPAWISHAAAARAQPLGLLGDALHLCAAGSWIGGLIPLAMFLTYARESVSLGEKAALVVSRYSTLSLCCVGALVVSGISNAWLLVGSISALFTTHYGELLLLKMALFGILVGFGARNRSIVRTRLAKAPSNADLLSELRRNVIWEACLGAAVVAIVACLGVTPPAVQALS